MMTKPTELQSFTAMAEAKKANNDLHLLLIEKHIKPLWQPPHRASIEYFLESEEPTGGFLLALMDFAEAYHAAALAAIRKEVERVEEKSTD